MECWACGFLTPGSEGLQNLDVKHVNRITAGGWGVTLLRVKGAWELYGRMTGLSAGLDTSHNWPNQSPHALLSRPFSLPLTLCFSCLAAS